MEYLKHGQGMSRAKDEQHELMRPMTPRSERRRSSYGSMLSGVQSLDGLCTLTSKCVLKEGHTVPCWPGD